MFRNQIYLFIQLFDTPANIEFLSMCLNIIVLSSIEEYLDACLAVSTAEANPIEFVLYKMIMLFPREINNILRISFQF